VKENALSFRLLGETPELKTLAIDCFLDRIAREVMGRNPVRADHAGNSPGTVVRREFAPHWVAGKGAQRLPCLGLEDIEAHGLAFLRSTSGLRAADDARHRAAAITSHRVSAAGVVFD
jgi:hypothetical protein